MASFSLCEMAFSMHQNCVLSKVDAVRKIIHEIIRSLQRILYISWFMSLSFSNSWVSLFPIQIQISVRNASWTTFKIRSNFVCTLDFTITRWKVVSGRILSWPVTIALLCDVIWRGQKTRKKSSMQHPSENSKFTLLYLLSFERLYSGQVIIYYKY